jgi:hypothetical protein
MVFDHEGQEALDNHIKKINSTQQPSRRKADDEPEHDNIDETVVDDYDDILDDDDEEGSDSARARRAIDYCDNAQAIDTDDFAIVRRMGHVDDCGGYDSDSSEESKGQDALPIPPRSLRSASSPAAIVPTLAPGLHSISAFPAPDGSDRIIIDDKAYGLRYEDDPVSEEDLEESLNSDLKVKPWIARFLYEELKYKNPYCRELRFIGEKLLQSTSSLAATGSSSLLPTTTANSAPSPPSSTAVVSFSSSSSSSSSRTPQSSSSSLPPQSSSSSLLPRSSSSSLLPRSGTVVSSSSSSSSSSSARRPSSNASDLTRYVKAALQSEVAFFDIVSVTIDNTTGSKVLRLALKSGESVDVNMDSYKVEPLTYPLLFLRGEPGWSSSDHQVSNFTYLQIFISFSVLKN